MGVAMKYRHGGMHWLLQDRDMQVIPLGFGQFGFDPVDYL